MHEIAAMSTESENHADAVWSFIARTAEAARVLLASFLAVATFLALAILLAAGPMGTLPTP